MLYKYRDFNNFERVLDIILNKRLYAAKYTELNDPMEGIFRHRGLHKDILAKLKEEKEILRICSFSRKCNDSLMWAHYANGEKGIAIGIKEECLAFPVIRNVNYSGIMEHVTANTMVQDILSCKNQEWCYEQEVRVFTKKEYINIEIEEIIMGSRITSEHEKIIKKLKDKIGYDFEITKLRDVLDR
jgi:hypothetical protein